MCCKGRTTMNVQPSEQQSVLIRSKAVKYADHLKSWFESLSDADHPIAIVQQRNILTNAKVNVPASGRQKINLNFSYHLSDIWTNNMHNYQVTILNSQFTHS